jgi:hypothetical protein
MNLRIDDLTRNGGAYHRTRTKGGHERRRT